MKAINFPAKEYRLKNGMTFTTRKELLAYQKGIQTAKNRIDFELDVMIKQVIVALNEGPQPVEKRK